MLDRRRQVWCWGANLYGQLGDGSTDDSPDVAVRVQGVSGATAITTGDDFSCALITQGRVKCWGFDLSGQLGGGQAVTIAMAGVGVLGLRGATAVSAGGNHVCAIVHGGSVRCWGGNEFGQLGDGTLIDRRHPVKVVGLDDATSISAGDGFSCAAERDGRVVCWGLNLSGQLGDGSYVDRSRPVPVIHLSGALAVTTGLMTTCASSAGGAVDCWGSNDSAQLGRSVKRESSDRPVPVDALKPASRLAVGERAACAVLQSGAVSCTGGPRRSDRIVDFTTPAAGIALTGDDVCAILTSARVECSSG